jgi:hypothetical protein
VQVGNPDEIFFGIFPGIPVRNPAGISRRFPEDRRRLIRTSGCFPKDLIEKSTTYMTVLSGPDHPEKSRQDFLKEYVIPFTRFFSHHIHDNSHESSLSFHPEKSRQDFLKEYVIPFTRFFIVYHESVITFMRTITNPLFLFIKKVPAGHA